MIEFIKNNKLLSVVSAIAIVVIGIFVWSLFNAPKSKIPNAFPTPTPNQIQRPSPTDTNTEGFQEAPPDTTKLWILQLPLKSSLYYVEYFSYDDTIRAHIYPTGQLFYYTKEDEVRGIKEDIQNQLKNLGVDTEQQKIEWIVEN